MIVIRPNFQNWNKTEKYPWLEFDLSLGVRGVRGAEPPWNYASATTTTDREGGRI